MNDKHVLLAGLTDHEAAAIEIMIGMTWRDHKCVVLKRDLSMNVPEQTPEAKNCRYCVIDMLSLGMRKHSPETQARLLDFLQGRSAVLLIRGNGGGWQEALLPLPRGQQLTWLPMPYTSISLREALKTIKSEVQEPPPEPAPAPAAPAAHSGPGSLTRSLLQDKAAPAPAPEPEPQKPAADDKVPAWRRALLMAERLRSGSKGAPAVVTEEAAALVPAAAPQAAGPASVPPAAPVSKEAGKDSGLLSMAPPAVRVSEQAHGLNQEILSRLQDIFPALRQIPLMRFIGKLIGGAHLLRTGPTVFVLDTRAGWIASLSSVSSIRKMLQTPGILDTVEVQPLLSGIVDDVARQHFGKNNIRNREPLDVLVWELMADHLTNVQLQRQGNLSFQLRRFPNFSQLEQVGPMDVQLAAICARMPQSIEDLLRAFPKHEQDVLRFVVLCVCSGLAAVYPAQKEGAAPVAEPAVAPAPAVSTEQTKVRRGFFKSLLDKLF